MASPASAPSTVPKKRPFVNSFSKWVQTIGIIIAAGWGVYTFVYKEITLPKSAPIDISMSMQLKKVGLAKPKGKLMAVEMRVTATNPSSRKVYVLPSMWMVWGTEVHLNAPGDVDYKRIAELMNVQGGEFLENNVHPQVSTLLAAGSLFWDETLSPNETLTRTIIVYIPRARYDELAADAYMPSSPFQRACVLRWVPNEKAAPHSSIPKFLSLTGTASPNRTMLRWMKNVRWPFPAPSYRFGSELANRLVS
jgi:hypothetical protein